MPVVIGIDPGPLFSAFAVWDGSILQEIGYIDNRVMRQRLMRRQFKKSPEDVAANLVYCAIERVRAYGVPASNDLIDTAEWSARYYELFGPATSYLIPRKDIAKHLCQAGGSSSDTFVRKALEDQFGGEKAAMGTHSNPGPLYTIYLQKGHDRSHFFAALGVAITFWETMLPGILKKREQEQQQKQLQPEAAAQ